MSFATGAERADYWWAEWWKADKEIKRLKEEYAKLESTKPDAVPNCMAEITSLREENNQLRKKLNRILATVQE